MIEEEVFRKTKVNFNKLDKYGFKREKSIYKYYKNIMDDVFRVMVLIDNRGIVSGKIYDLSFDCEYVNFRIEDNMGAYARQVRNEYIKILEDIRDKCFINKYFIYDQSNRIANLIKKKYGDSPIFEWEKFPGYATFKNKDSKKWYGIIMNIDKSKLDENMSGEVEILNIKIEPSEGESLKKREGFYSAYHMNKKNWISIILDNTVSDKEIMDLLDKSYSYAIGNSNVFNEWIVPANPKFFDVEGALEKNSTMIWKQSTSIRVNDIVYLYMARPYSSIMYKFKVVEINIPYEYHDENIRMQRVMKIKLMKRYDSDKLSFEVLKRFGINAIRGPRYVSLDLSNYIASMN